MNCEDRYLIEFVLSWAPYGGPPADRVFCEFGFGRTQLWQRFVGIVTAAVASAHRLTPDEHKLANRAHHYQLVTLAQGRSGHWSESAR